MQLNTSDYYLVYDYCDQLSFGELIEKDMVFSRRGEMPLRIIKLVRSNGFKQEENADGSVQAFEDMPNTNKAGERNIDLNKNITNSILARNIGQYSTKKSPTNTPYHTTSNLPTQLFIL